jgi:tetratricopeptide (TPR) repeat protein
VDQQLAQSEVARLETMVRSGGASQAFPALCEAHRRSGRPEEAERLAREGLRRHPEQTAGRVALGLALMDLGRLEEARSELVRVLDAVPDHPLAQAALPETQGAPLAEGELLEEIAEGELEQAFAAAEADPEEMIDANGVAAAVVRAVESEPYEAEAVSDLDDAREGEIALDHGQVAIETPFATRSMADLLERQGRTDEAQELRASLDLARAAEADGAERNEAAPADAEPAGGERDRVVRTLEGWLQNLRKGRR